jgi:hypothetical protein
VTPTFEQLPPSFGIVASSSDTGTEARHTVPTVL